MKKGIGVGLIILFLVAIIIFGIFSDEIFKTQEENQETNELIELKGIFETCNGTESLCDSCGLGYLVNGSDGPHFFSLYINEENQNIPGNLEEFLGKEIILRGYESQAKQTNSPCAYLFSGKELALGK